MRQYAEKMPLTKAVTSAIDYCIAHDILRDFLLKERKAVAMYSLYEYNQAGHMKAVRNEGIQQGIALGEERGKNNTVALFAWLNKNNRQDDIQRAFDDPEFLDKLFDEFTKDRP